jgi:fucose permease
MFAILVFAVNGQIFPSLLSMLGGTSIQQGTLLASLFLLFPVTAATAGHLADRIGKRLILFVGALAMAVPFALAAVFETLWIRTLVVLLFGIGGGMIEGQASALLADLHPGRERRMIGLSQMFFSIGAAGSPFLIVLVFQLFPAATPRAFLGSAAAISSVLAVALLLPRDAELRRTATDPVSLPRLLSHRGWRRLAIMLFLYVAAEIGTVSWLAKYGAETLGMDPSVAPIGISLFWAGLAVSRGLVGALTLSISDRTLIGVALIVTLVSRIAAFTVPWPIAALALFLLVGFGMGVVWPTIVAVAGRTFRASSGAAVGTMLAAGALGIPVIQPVMGALTQLWGLQAALLSLGLLTITNLFLCRRIDH